MTDLEATILNAFLSGNRAEMAVLRKQAHQVRIHKREYTGVGFFTEFTVPAEVPRVTWNRLVISDVGADIVGLDNGAGFVLFVQDGAIRCLEGYAYGDEVWPTDARISRWYYLRHPNPDTPALVETSVRDLNYALSERAANTAMEPTIGEPWFFAMKHDGSRRLRLIVKPLGRPTAVYRHRQGARRIAVVQEDQFIVYEAEHWRVNQRADATLPGYLVVSAKEPNAVSLSDLSTGALAEMGIVLEASASALEKRLHPLHIYICRFGHEPGHAVHFHVIPIYGWVKEAYDRTVRDGGRTVQYPNWQDGSSLTLFVTEEFSRGRIPCELQGPGVTETIQVLKDELDSTRPNKPLQPSAEKRGG